MKKFLLPCTILAVLLTLWFFRWDYTATHTVTVTPKLEWNSVFKKSSSSTTKVEGPNIYKWKLDRWTGQGWLEISNKKGISNQPINPFASHKPYLLRNVFTRTWQLITMLTIIWLSILLVKLSRTNQ